MLIRPPVAPAKKATAMGVPGRLPLLMSQIKRKTTSAAPMSMYAAQSVSVLPNPSREDKAPSER